MLEQTFQQTLRLALAGLSSVRLWRQPAGRIQTIRATWVECAPVGAADLSGIVHPEGWRLEVECKGERTPIEPAQARWLKFIRAMGGVALVVRDDGTPESINRAVAAIASAITERRAR